MTRKSFWDLSTKYGRRRVGGITLEENSSGVKEEDIGTNQTGDIIDLLLEFYEDTLGAMEMTDGYLRSLRYSHQNQLSDTQRRQVLSGVKAISMRVRASMENLQAVREDLDSLTSTDNRSDT